MEPDTNIHSVNSPMHASYETLDKRPSKSSWIWRVIHQVIPTMQKHVVNILGNSKYTTIWFNI